VIESGGGDTENGGIPMAKNTRQTSKKVAHQASVILSSTKSTKTQKSVAASALAQTKKGS
jgi:hypothetical protein